MTGLSRWLATPFRKPRLTTEGATAIPGPRQASFSIEVLHCDVSLSVRFLGRHLFGGYLLHNFSDDLLDNLDFFRRRRLDRLLACLRLGLLLLGPFLRWWLCFALRLLGQLHLQILNLVLGVDLEVFELFFEGFDFFVFGLGSIPQLGGLFVQIMDAFQVSFNFFTLSQLLLSHFLDLVLHVFVVLP